MRNHVLERTPRVRLDYCLIKNLRNHLNRTTDLLNCTDGDGNELKQSVSLLGLIDGTIELFSCVHVLIFEKIEE